MFARKSQICHAQHTQHYLCIGKHRSRRNLRFRSRAGPDDLSPGFDSAITHRLQRRVLSTQCVIVDCLYFDEPDYSTQPVNFYINFLRSLKGLRHPDKIRASAIGPYNTSTCQSRGNCRYYAVAQALRGIYSHITSNNWGSTLSNLGAVTFGYRSQFFLSRPADPKTIVVKVNGQTIPQGGSNGWTYDASNNTVNFGKGAVPAAGALIEISYSALCLPP